MNLEIRNVSVKWQNMKRMGGEKKGPGWLGLELDRDATVFSPSPHPQPPT